MTPDIPSKEVERVAAGLTATMREMLAEMVSERWHTWFSAADFPNYNIASFGSLLNAMTMRGIFERRSDPKVWGRSQYRVTALLPALRTYLERTAK